MKKIFLISLLLIILTIGCVSASDNMTLNDDDAADTPSGEVLSEIDISHKNFNELNEVINKNNDTEIYLNENYVFNNESEFINGITISRDVTINGNGFTLDGNNQARIFNVTNPSVILKNINFINGYSDDGGAIYGQCNVINCTFINNLAENSGGAMFTGTATDCNFLNNTAKYSGGAIFLGTATNSNFTGNNAYFGGAINYGDSATNCIFINNNATESGGAVFNITAINSIFIKNIAGNYGGAITQSSAINCSFTNNAAMQGKSISHSSATNCNFTNDLSTVETETYLSNIENCSFKNNTAEIKDPTNIPENNTKTFTDLNEKINANNNTDIYLNENYIWLENETEFTEGIVINRAVTIYGNGHTINGANEARIFDVKNKNVIFKDLTLINGVGYGYYYSSGGAINGECTAINCTFKNNYAVEEGGAMCRGTAINCTFIANRAQFGGGIYNGIAINCIFKENIGQGEGMNGGTAKNCTFYDGYVGTEILAENQMIPKSFKELETLIINNYNTEIYLDGNYSCIEVIRFSEGIEITQPITIHGNGYTINGKSEARIFNVKSDNVIFENITFINTDHLGGYGGAINGNCTAINCIFKNNYASKQGGAMNGGTAINCTFKNNYAQEGGALYNCTAINCEFDHNNGWYGGAINKGTAIDCYFYDNYAEIGGAMLDGVAISCIFERNRGMIGGALSSSNAKNCTFKENQVGDSEFPEKCHDGAMSGGIAENCIFIDNHPDIGSCEITTKPTLGNNQFYLCTNMSNYSTGYIFFKIPKNVKGDFITYIDGQYVKYNPNNIIKNYNGQSFDLAPIEYNNLSLGNHTIALRYLGGDEYSTSLITGNFNVEMKSHQIIINAPNKIYKGENLNIEVYVPYATGNVILSAQNRNLTSGIKDGKASFTVTDLTAGTHEINVYYSEGGKLEPNSAKTNIYVVYAPKIVASDKTVFYNDGNKFSVTVYGEDGKTANGVSVIFKVDGKKVATVKTSSKGVASYKITQTPKTYKISATALSKTVTKKLVVKQILTLKTVTVKKSAKKLDITATLKGKTVLKNKQVTFKFNGKTQKVKTNSKGIAKATVPKSVLSKLKVGEKVTYQVTYLKDTVKKTATVKK